MLSRGVHFFAVSLGALVCVFMLAATASAISVSETEVSSTLSTISVSSAVDLYAYEVNLSYTGSVSAANFAGFLGDSTSSGYNTRGSYVYVYETKLDPTQTGASGSGALFNLTHSGDLTVCSLLAIDSTGSEERVSTGSCDSESAGTGSTIGGSTGGGGGGSTTKTVNASTAILSEAGKLIDFSAEEIIVTAILGRETTRTLTVGNAANKPVVIELSQEGFGNALVLPEKLELAANEEKTITLLFMPSEQKLLMGKIIFEVAGERIKEVLAIVNVRSENFLFDSILTLGRKHRVITPGEPIVAQINLEQVGVSGMKIDVIANYFIRDFAGNSYLEDSETFFVDGSKEYVKVFPTDNLPIGKYALSLEIVYLGAFATSSAQFEVRDKESQFIMSFIGGAILVIAVGLVFFWAIRHKPLMSHKHNTWRSYRS